MTGPQAPETTPLGRLLERERACVRVVVAMANGATEHAEREICASLGGRLVLSCCALRERLAPAGEPETRATSTQATAVLAVEAYDARLLAFAELLERTAEQATEALTATTDGEAQRTLRDLIETHGQAAQWCRVRAAEFAASRARYLPADPPADEQP